MHWADAKERCENPEVLSPHVGSAEADVFTRGDSVPALRYARRRFAAVFLRGLEAERAAARFTGF